MNKLLSLAGFALLLAVCCPRPAAAQIAPYAMFSLGHYSGLGVGPGTTATQSGGITSLGGTFGVNYDPLHVGPIAVGVDLRGIVQNSANSTPYGSKLAGGLVGPRVEVNTLVLPFRPYAQVEIGDIATNNGTQSNKVSSFAYQVQGGADFTVLPHVAVRAEYGLGQLTGGGFNTSSGQHHTLQTLGAGIVIRL